MSGTVLGVGMQQENMCAMGAYNNGINADSDDQKIFSEADDT